MDETTKTLLLVGAVGLGLYFVMHRPAPVVMAPVQAQPAAAKPAQPDDTAAIAGAVNAGIGFADDLVAALSN